MGGLTLDFRPTLPVVTHDQGRLGKMDCFGGMYCCFRGQMGPLLRDGDGVGGLTLEFRPTLPVVSK